MGPAADDEGTRAPLEVRRSWARFIRQAYEVDPLLCPRCGGTMKVLAAIERSGVIRQVRSAEPLDLLGALSHAEGLATKPCFDDLPVPDPLNA